MTTLVQLNFEDLRTAFKACLKDAINELRNLPAQPEPLDRIDLAEAMQLTGCSKSLIYKLSMLNQIPAQKFGKRLVFSRKDLQAWMESRTIAKIDINKIATDQLAKEAQKKL